MDSLENLAQLVSRMSLDEDTENQASGTGFMLEVPEKKIPQFIGDGKDEIIPVIDNPVNAVQNRTKLCVPER